ncbi:hypothetical protein DPEC_G00047280 [Dallia pectoralis]|uniref:Uncharacterized protein n=1 Tax=Dallia pectoralis TaxID=75939 RepID=A0ACC2HAT1_DALPE|nr:hypothetical protein DPEC_G00047280 [Dallia pectoralis]
MVMESGRGLSQTHQPPGIILPRPGLPPRLSGPKSDPTDPEFILASSIRGAFTMTTDGCILGSPSGSNKGPAMCLDPRHLDKGLNRMAPGESGTGGRVGLCLSPVPRNHYLIYSHLPSLQSLIDGRLLINSPPAQGLGASQRYAAGPHPARSLTDSLPVG